MQKKFLTVVTCMFVLATSSIYAQQSEKKKIESIDDLPRHTYKVTGTLTELITHEIAFKPFAAQVRADIEKDLEDYEIEDKTTLKDFYGVLINLDMLSGNYDAALRRIRKVQELEDKSADKLTKNLIDEAIIQAHREVGQKNDNVYKKIFSQSLSQAIEKLPWEVVQERIEYIKGDMDLYGKNVLLGLIQSQYEPGVEKSHQIGNDVATQVIGARYLIEIVLPLKEHIIEVLGQHITANRVEKPNMWKERSVDISHVSNLQPVVIAIWDTGVDIGVFPDQLFVNDKEKINDKDDDNNGYIDDVHGIAYTLDMEKTAKILYPIEHPERLSEMKQMIKGLNDIQSAIDSPEAAALKQKIATVNPEDVKPFIEEVTQFALFIHGTYTAGLAAEGNPYARILVARFTGDYRTIPLPPTIEEAKKRAKACKETIEYFKANGARVVNMSWTGTLRATETALEVNGIGKDAQERAKLAREMFDIEKNAIYDAMKNAPDVLFVTSAGNENDDIAFEDYYPNAFVLPNLLVVGAVDQAGDETSFTSFGERVDVYANGYEVESYIPGGEKMPASGTSASSPNAANLAAKLLALNSSLTPEQVIILITDGADQNESGRMLINPKRSVELLQASRIR
ncbi:MAG: S8 family serine peptidase [candidate division WOR-3 bacterium]|nr:MAG: S8 family serine peptidase [candidate division WOR-3 bacterium]